MSGSAMLSRLMINSLLGFVYKELFYAELQFKISNFAGTI